MQTLVAGQERQKSGASAVARPTLPSATPPLPRFQRARLVRVGSFDHLVGAAEQREWHREPKRLGSLEVKDQFDFGELLHRQIGGVLALENATDIDADLAI